MIYYACKYTPVEIFESFGEEVKRIEPDVSNFVHSDSLMHPDICCFVKGLLEECIKENKDIVLTTCCDSIKRFYDVLNQNMNEKFIYILDLPRKNTEEAALIYKSEIVKMIHAYEDYKGAKFNIESFRKILWEKHESNNVNNSNGGINLMLTGARFKDSLIDKIKEEDVNICSNLSCTGDMREIGLSCNYDDCDDILLAYSESLLNLYPCVRMINADKRYSIINTLPVKPDGIIYNTIKFCDSYSFDYAALKNYTDIPVLKIETDYTESSEGQLKTRIEAFIESLKSPYKNDALRSSSNLQKSDKYFAGIDSGSTSTNVVIINENKEIVSYDIVRTGAKSIESAERAFNETLQKANLKRSQIAKIVSTGYGRVSIPFADTEVTEITCHAKGANFVNPHIRTIIDIGGQDSKVIRIDEKGNVTDFAMNDKCAAGTGRFLEMMSRTLEIPIDEMGKESLKSSENIKITSMCTVFAESEVISLIAQNKEKADIIRGLNNSIASKIVSLLGRIGKKEEYMMTGGVAKNIGVVKAMEEKLECRINIYKEPEIIGALGAALIGSE